MSSTPAVVIPISVPSSLFPNAPSPSSVSSGHTTSPVSVFTSATTSSTSSTNTTRAFSEQSQQTSPDKSTTTTTSTAMDTIAMSSSTVPSSSANTSSTFSSARSFTTSTDVTGWSTTSTSETILPTTPSTSSPTIFQSSTFTPSSTISVLGNTTPLNILPSTTTPFNTPYSTSSYSSPQSFPVGAGTPLTTVFASTTIFITTTNGQGQLTISAPPVVTEAITTTGSNGIASTITQVAVNPTLASNNSTVNGESFFSDTGAVVGVFVVVGLACASIMMWILFAIRRRQRMRRIEQDTVAEAAVAAAGLNRTPLDDDDEDGSLASPNTHRQSSPRMGQRNRVLGPGFLPTSARVPEMLDGPVRGSTNPCPRFPAGRRTSTGPEGYMPARTISPLPQAEQCVDDLGSSRDRRSSYGHTPTYSAGSFEPLLANYARTTSDRDTPAPGVESPQNRSLQHMGSTSAPYSSESPGNGSPRNSLKRQNSSDSSVFRDEEDYTRYVLMVRNVPDDQSQHSL